MCQVACRKVVLHGQIEQIIHITVTEHRFSLNVDAGTSTLNARKLPFLNKCSDLTAKTIYGLLHIRLDTLLFKTLSPHFYSEPLTPKGSGVRCHAPNAPGLGSHLSENFNLTTYYSYLTLLPKVVKSTNSIEGREMFISSTSLDPALTFYLFNMRGIPIRRLQKKMESISVQAVIDRGELGDCLIQNFGSYIGHLETYLKSPNFRAEGLIKKLNALTNFIYGYPLEEFAQCGVFLPLIHGYAIDKEQRSLFEDVGPDILCIPARRIVSTASGRSRERTSDHSDVVRKIRNYCYGKGHLNTSTLLLNRNAVSGDEVTLEWVLRCLDEAGHLSPPLKVAFDRFLTANIERLLDFDLGMRMFLDEEQRGGSSLDSHPEIFTNDCQTRDIRLADFVTTAGKRTYETQFPDDFEISPTKRPRVDPLPASIITIPPPPPSDLLPGKEIIESTLDNLFSTLHSEKTVVFPTSYFRRWHDFCRRHWEGKKFNLSLNKALRLRQTLFKTRKPSLPTNMKSISHLVLPVLSKGHWSVIIYNHLNQSLHHLDSIYNPNLAWLQEAQILVRSIIARSLVIDKAPVAAMRPLQPDGTVDCGVFAYFYTSNFIHHGAGRFDFTASDVPQLRQRLSDLWVSSHSS